MNKILLAFAGGLVVASGVTFLLMRKPTTATVRVAQSQPPAQTTTTTTPAEAPAPAQTAPAAAPVQPAPAPHHPPARVEEHRHARPKPSPVVRHSTERADPTPPTPAKPASAPVEVAQSTPPPAAAQTETPQPPPAPAPAPPTPAVTVPPPPPARVPHTETIPAGTLLSIRLGETLSSDRNEAGDTFVGTLDQPLIVDGFIIAERGSKIQGRVVDCDRAGRVHGTAHMSIALSYINTSDGQRVRVDTDPFNRDAPSVKKKDAEKVGIGAALGAAIGAIAGGGKGAGIGAGVGGAAGAGDVLLTRGKPAELPVETRITFRLAKPVTLTERLH
jgi:hypothetical protein